MVGSTATVADHNIPGAHPITLIDIRPKSELPFAKEALDHMRNDQVAPGAAPFGGGTNPGLGRGRTFIALGAAPDIGTVQHLLNRPRWPSRLSDRPT